MSFWTELHRITRRADRDYDTALLKSGLGHRPYAIEIISTLLIQLSC
jgi:hypothetical protein